MNLDTLTQSSCPFCLIAIDDHEYGNLILRTPSDGPTTALVIYPRAHRTSVTEWSVSEWLDLQTLLAELRSPSRRVPAERSFNIGINEGNVAGQTVAHSHVHYIPRTVSGRLPGQGMRWWLKEDRPLGELLNDIQAGVAERGIFTAIREASAVADSLSRTVISGRVDITSKAATSGHQPASGDLTGRARSAIENSVTKLFRFRRIDFVPDLLIEVNRQLSSSTFSGAGLRTTESPKHSYLAPYQIAEHMGSFCARIRAGNHADIPELLWDVHQSINYYGHYFADGCGRTASVIGAWLSWLESSRVWILPSRDEYLKLLEPPGPDHGWSQELARLNSTGLAETLTRR